MLGCVPAVADAYSAMQSDRPHRAALSDEATMAELRAGAGTQFDSEFVTAFVD